MGVVRQDIHALEFSVSKEKDYGAALWGGVEGRLRPEFQTTLADAIYSQWNDEN